MTGEQFSMIGAVPGTEPGRTGWNLLCGAVYAGLIVAWPIVAAYAVATNSGESADWLSGLPGIDAGGGLLSGLTALAASGVAVWGGLWALTKTVPAVTRILLLPTLPTLYALVLGYFVLDSVGAFRGWVKLYRSETDSLLELSAGPVQVTGRALEAGDTVEAPYSGVETLTYESERQRYEVPDDEHVADRNTGSAHTDGIELQSKSWVTKESASDAVPFEIRGDGGAALVDPGDAKLVLEETYRETERDEERYIERRIDPSDNVYVSGVARPASVADVDGDGHRWIIAEPRSNLSPPMRRLRHMPVTLSDHGESGARDALFKRGIATGILSLIFGFPLLMGFIAPLVVRLARDFGYLA